VIERQITIDTPEGKVKRRFHVSTRCHTIKAALAQLERFEADPAGYSPLGADVRDPLPLTLDLVDGFYRYQLARVSAKYARETNTWLLTWVRGLRGKDLRSLKARDLIPTLDAATPGARRPLKAAIKTLFAWLRVERHELTAAEDCTRDLHLEQSDPAKRTRPVAHPIENVRAVLKRLRGVYRDALIFQWATSCHVSELERFVRDDRSRLVKVRTTLADGTKALAVVELWHKTGDWHRIALTRAEHVKAAQRLKARGSLPTRSDLNATIYAVCDALKIPRMSYVMRHTTLTRAASRGVALDRRMAHANHRNRETAERYVDIRLPLGAIPAERI
jgi:hypothetical protein